MDLANQRLFVEATSPHSIVRYEPSMGEACEPTKRQTIMALYENIGIDHYE